MVEWRVKGGSLAATPFTLLHVVPLPKHEEELQPVIGRFTLPASSRCSGPYATTALSGSGA